MSQLNTHKHTLDSVCSNKTVSLAANSSTSSDVSSYSFICMQFKKYKLTLWERQGVVKMPKATLEPTICILRGTLYTMSVIFEHCTIQHTSLNSSSSLPHVCCGNLQWMKKTLPEPRCCLWPDELWLKGDLWGMADSSSPVRQNVIMSLQPETWTGPFPSDALVPPLLIWTLHHRLQPIRKHPPTVMSLLVRAQRAVFLPTVSAKMLMSLWCCWRPVQRTCCWAAYDYHGRSTCQLRWPTTSVMTSTVV